MRKLAALVAAVAALVASSIATRAETLKVAVPHPGLWDSTLVDFARANGYFKDVDVEFFFTEGGGQQIQTVVSGSADVGLLNGLLSVMAAYVKGAPIRVISAEFTGAYDPFWYVRADSPIKDFSQVGGHTVGFSVNGSSSHLTLLALLRQAGVKDARPTATGSQVSTLTQVMSGQIDVGYTVPPVGMKELEEGKIRALAYGRDAKELLGQTVRVNIANADALRTKRDAIGKLLAGYKRAIDAAYDDPNMLPVIAASMKISPDALRAIREGFYPRAAMQLAEVKDVDGALRDAYDNKYIPRPMKAADVAGLFDLGLAPK